MCRQFESARGHHKIQELSKKQVSLKQSQVQIGAKGPQSQVLSGPFSVLRKFGGAFLRLFSSHASGTSLLGGDGWRFAAGR